jgi:hypothetical protein
MAHHEVCIMSITCNVSGTCRHIISLKFRTWLGRKSENGAAFYFPTCSCIEVFEEQTSSNRNNNFTWERSTHEVHKKTFFLLCFVLFNTKQISHGRFKRVPCVPNFNCSGIMSPRQISGNEILFFLLTTVLMLAKLVSFLHSRKSEFRKQTSHVHFPLLLLKHNARKSEGCDQYYTTTFFIVKEAKSLLHHSVFPIYLYVLL